MFRLSLLHWMQTLRLVFELTRILNLRRLQMLLHRLGDVPFPAVPDECSCTLRCAVSRYCPGYTCLAWSWILELSRLSRLRVPLHRLGDAPSPQSCRWTRTCSVSRCSRWMQLYLEMIRLPLLSWMQMLGMVLVLPHRLGYVPPPIFADGFGDVPSPTLPKGCSCTLRCFVCR
jgi:hypothetical protein